MDDAAIYIVLQGAVERSKGAASWTDVRLALMRAKEAKVKAALDSVFADFNLETLMHAEEIADREVFRMKPDTVSVTPPPERPPPLPKGGKYVKK